MIKYIQQNNWKPLRLKIQNIKPSSVFILVDTNTRKYCLPKLGFTNVNIIEIKPGEENKNFHAIFEIWEQLINSGADRNSLLVNLGGGLVTDLGGFAASTFKRGIKFIHIPTTLLAMVDAAIGGKNGFNFKGIKNQIGTIVEPEGIFIEPSFLETLPHKEYMSGLAEMLKHGLIASPRHFDEIMQNPFRVDKQIIKDSIAIKRKIIEADPYEKHLRKVLNFGHTFGHALETAYHKLKKPLTHGHAVALGMMIEVYLSSLLTGLENQKAGEIIEALSGLYTIPETIPDSGQTYAWMRHDKKNRNGQIFSVLLEKPGKPAIDVILQKKDIDAGIQALRQIKEGRLF